MTRLPERPDPDHLKKQAKDLLAAARRRQPEALARFRAALPAARGKGDVSLPGRELRLHDAQSCLAREYGFSSWTELMNFVTARRALSMNRAEAVRQWLRLIYPGDISGSANRASPAAAARLLEEIPDLPGDDPWLACAIGDIGPVKAAMRRDPGWVGRVGGPLDLPPLVAATHSSLVRLPRFRERLHGVTRLLLAAGADPNPSITSRWPFAESGQTFPLSALYGAAGQNHDPELTRLLLEAGAEPNDGESLYHSLESPACVRLLLESGARVAGSNAMYRVLDLDNLESLRLLLAHGGDPNEPARGRPTSDWGRPLLWAIRRGRSAAHVRALLDAGADPAARTPNGVDARTLALRFGLPDAAVLFDDAAGRADLSAEEHFLAACAAGDETTARRLRAIQPDLPASLSENQLLLLPELAALGRDGAVRTMVRLGWPIALQGGDWNASALNHAVFRGDAALARFLLEHGADWRERHGFGDNACGSLAWASQNEPEGPGDWPGCARALLDHGMPPGRSDAGKPGAVIVDGRHYQFSDEVTEILLGAAPAAS